MSLRNSCLALAGLAFLATPGQGQEREIVVQAFGGGYNHLANLNTGTPAADFKTGFNLGAAVGVQLNRNIAVYGDFTWALTVARGDVPFLGAKIARYFVGARGEYQYPMGRLAPFAFVGAGTITVDEQDSVPREDIKHFTRLAGVFGGGVRYQLPNVPVEVLAEGKVLTYKWAAPPFSRTQWDFSYSIGVAYRFGL